MLNLRATGKHEDLEERLYDYEEETNITLKIFMYTIIKPNEQSISTKEYSYKVLEIENKNNTFAKKRPENVPPVKRFLAGKSNFYYFWSLFR